MDCSQGTGWALVNVLWATYCASFFFFWGLFLSLSPFHYCYYYCSYDYILLRFHYQTVFVSTHEFYVFFPDCPSPHTVSRVSSCLLGLDHNIIILPCVNSKREEACFSSALQLLAGELCPHNLLRPRNCHKFSNSLVLWSTSHGELLNNVTQYEFKTS